MNWRPWIVSASLLASFILTVVLWIKEEAPVPKKVKVVEVEVGDRLASYAINASTRVQLWEQYGFDNSEIEQMVGRTNRMLGDRSEQYRKLLQEDPPKYAMILCPSAGAVPPRYSALQLLVREDVGVRTPIPPGELVNLESQEWYATAPVQEVFKKLDLRKEAKIGATGMGVAAILLQQEVDAIGGRGAWSTSLSFGWNLPKLFEKNVESSLKQRVYDYFVLSQTLLELANATENGICK